MSYANPVMTVKKRSPKNKRRKNVYRFKLFLKIAFSTSIKASSDKAMRDHGHNFAIKRDELPERCAPLHVSGLFILVATRSAIIAREIGARLLNKGLYDREKNHD